MDIEHDALAAVEAVDTIGSRAYRRRYRRRRCLAQGKKFLDFPCLTGVAEQQFDSDNKAVAIEVSEDNCDASYVCLSCLGLPGCCPCEKSFANQNHAAPGPADFVLSPFSKLSMSYTSDKRYI